MSNLESSIATAVKNMSLMNSDESRMLLKKEAQSHSIQAWKNRTCVKVSGVGVLTGLLGGPVGVLLEVADIAYLLAPAGRGCYGVGHILGCEIDYDDDINGILAIWAGVAIASHQVPLGKIGFKIACKSVVKISGKISVKVALKTGTKVSQKIVAKAAAKIASKVTTKIGAKWIPVAGGVVSGGINLWVASGLMNAAEKYYTGEYLIFNQDIDDINQLL